MIHCYVVVAGHPVDCDRAVKQRGDSFYFCYLVFVVTFVDHVAAHNDEGWLQPVRTFDGTCEKRRFGGKTPSGA